MRVNFMGPIDTDERELEIGCADSLLTPHPERQWQLFYVFTLLFPLEMSIDICTFNLLTSHMRKGPSALVLTYLSNKKRSISISTFPNKTRSNY